MINGCRTIQLTTKALGALSGTKKVTKMLLLLSGWPSNIFVCSLYSRPI